MIGTPNPYPTSIARSVSLPLHCGLAGGAVLNEGREVGRRSDHEISWGSFQLEAVLGPHPFLFAI